MDLFIKETGDRNKQSIVFLHGGALAGWMWNEQLKYFKDYHCIVPDLQEHGKSKDVGQFTIDNAAAKVLNLIEKKSNNKKAHLVGISLGAQVALQMLSKSPELVDHVVLSGTLIRQIPQNEFILNLINHITKIYMPIKDTDFLIKANIRSYNIPKTYFEYLKESTEVIKKDSLSRIIHENMFFKIPDGLKKSNNPVLVLAGAKEYEIIKKSVWDLTKVLSKSKGYIAPEMVHTWNLAAPDFFNEVVKAWITDDVLSDSLIPIDEY
ncbi:alpha/beta fold hydrolase [Methanobacterium alcaliphilum]|uniref:alpha/beta fold hydrolase n=1 Tax=Methanobacterium alcaliphilum TaxID=392018 RepID=UPI00200A787B|nr:alpha/beta hydrolase [Methanobacterium alcaliphilum]MCK9152394.1 alpha/beta hydrolase [Methanobacterium alcaliphilum]